MENREGKRISRDTGPGKGAKVAVIAVAAVLVLVAAGYTGLCAVAGSGTLPNTTALGADISGMSAADAERTIQSTLQQKLSGHTITLSESSSGHTTTVPSDIVTVVDVAGALEEALPDGGFLSRGTQYLSRLTTKTDVTPSLTLTSEGEQALEEAARTLSTDLAQPMVETTYEVSGDNLVLTKGTTGAAIDGEAMKTDVLDALTQEIVQGGSARDLTVPVTLTNSPPPEPDFNAILQAVAVEPVDAYLNKDTKEIVPSVTGVSFDIPTASSSLSGAAEGEGVSVPLVYTEPELTTAGLNAVLFRDVLSTSTTTCSGNSNRISNIKTAANKINGLILMPGEVFSYNDEVGPYTRASGYLSAGTYQGGKSVDALAGGICQLSSTLYWSTLKANLEITERHNHQLNVDYLPKGCDATVYGGGPDFKFTNNTGQPMKIQSVLNGRSLTVTLIGTNTSGTHAVIESVVVSSDPCTVVYKADSSIPAGSAPKRDSAYPGHNGSVVKAYRVVYDSNGKEISRTLESTSKYARQDKVMLYNPADAASLGVNTATGKKDQVPVTPSPSVAPSTEPSATPSTPMTPPPSTAPEPSATPANTVAPSAEPTPVVTPTAVPTPAPTPDENTPAPPPEAGDWDMQPGDPVPPGG